jgi:hypothetical protein
MKTDTNIINASCDFLRKDGDFLKWWKNCEKKEGMPRKYRKEYDRLYEEIE